MNTNAIIGLILGIVAVVAGGYWFYSQSNNTDIVRVGDPSVERSNASVSNTFAQLLGGGASLECTFEYNDGVNVSSGTVYTADGGERIRGDFTITQSAGGSMEMHMVRAEGYNHLWGTTMPQGIKTKVTEENRAQLFDDSNTAIHDDTTYSCSAWRVDGSKFTLPANVDFIDASAMMESVKGMMPKGELPDGDGAQGVPSTDLRAMQCSACDQAGSAREQCRQALGCK